MSDSAVPSPETAHATDGKSVATASIKLPAPQRLNTWWDQYEVPTIALAIGLYAAWLLLVVWHATIPAPLLFVMGGYVAQLHFSLQHESIHAMRGMPNWLRMALVWPPINFWLPYPFYNGSHSTHHVNFHLTHPQKDTESYYHLKDQWPRFKRQKQWLLRVNQTLLFRLAIGPVLRIIRLIKVEMGYLLKGNFSRVQVWFWHVISALPVVWFVTQVAHMRWWEYVVYFIYPGMMLGALRTFTEHRWGETPLHRTAIVESNWVGGLLYLFNNMHQIHHRFPTLPWYHIPRYFAQHREAVLASNGGFYYRGYAEIAQRYWRTPVFDPVHPRW